MSDSPTPSPASHSGLPAGIDPAGLDPCFTQPERAPAIRFSEEIVEAILDLYLQGMPLYKIAAMEGMPCQGTVWKWMRDMPHFRERITACRRIRAMQHEEQALAVADPNLGKDEVPAARLAHDAHRWAAEVNDPEVYGKRTTIQGDATKPIVFKVISHIPESEQDRLDKAPAEVSKDIIIPADDPEPPEAA